MNISVVEIEMSNIHPPPKIEPNNNNCKELCHFSCFCYSHFSHRKYQRNFMCLTNYSMCVYAGSQHKGSKMYRTFQ